MKISSETTLRMVSALLARRPGPTPRMWTRAKSQTVMTAMMVCVENVIEANPRGICSSGVEFAAPGMNRCRYSGSRFALNAMAPANPATNEVQPVRNPSSGP